MRTSCTVSSVKKFLNQFSLQLRKVSDDRTITTDTIHDSADAVEYHPLAKMLHELGRVAMASDKSADRMLHLWSHDSFPVV